MSYKFYQYMGYYVPGKPLTCDLVPGDVWTAAKPKRGKTLVIVNQTVRRVLKRPDTPLQFTIQPNDQETLQAVLDLNSKSGEAHVAKFDKMGAEDKVRRDAVKTLASLSGLLISTRAMLNK